MTLDEIESAAMNLVAHLNNARGTLHEHGYVPFSGPLIDAYFEVTRDLYDASRFASTSMALLRATQLADGDSEMLAMLGEGPLRSWLETGGARVLSWSREQAELHAPWRESLRSVSLFYRPDVDAELRGIARYLRAVWDLPT